jgi:hypothetical protein
LPKSGNLTVVFFVIVSAQRWDSRRAVRLGSMGGYPLFAEFIYRLKKT